MNEENKMVIDAANIDTVPDVPERDDDGPRLPKTDPAADMAIRISDIIRTYWTDGIIAISHSMHDDPIHIQVRSDYFDRHYGDDCETEDRPQQQCICKYVEFEGGAKVFCLVDAKFKMVRK